MASAGFFSLASAFLEALSDGALLYSRSKALVAYNTRGGARLAHLAQDPADPWRFGDISLDALLHRVLEGAELTVSEWTPLAGGEGSIEVRASRIEAPGAGRHALVLLCPTRPSAADGDESLLREARHGLLAHLLPGVAHQLRGPLTTISGLAQVLTLSETLPEELTSKLSFIQPQVERADALLRNVVAFARGPRPSEFLPLSLNEAVRRAMELLAHELRASGIEGRLEVHRDVPLAGAHPEELLEMVLLLALDVVDRVPVTSRGELVLRTEALDGSGSQLTVDCAAATAPPTAIGSARFEMALRMAARMGGDIREPSATGGRRLVAVVPGLADGAEWGAFVPERVLIAEPNLDWALVSLRSVAAHGVPVTLARTRDVTARTLRRGRLAGALLDTDLALGLDANLLPARTMIAARPGHGDAARTLAERLGVPWALKDEAPARLRRLLEDDRDGALPAPVPGPAATLPRFASAGPPLPTRASSGGRARAAAR